MYCLLFNMEDATVGGYAPGADLAPLVADFLDTLGVGPLHVVGNSVGGAVVLRLALADPARVRTLTLVNSAVWAATSTRCSPWTPSR